MVYFVIFSYDPQKQNLWFRISFFKANFFPLLFYNNKKHKFLIFHKNIRKILDRLCCKFVIDRLINNLVVYKCSLVQNLDIYFLGLTIMTSRLNLYVKSHENIHLIKNIYIYIFMMF